jgi:hypothetical protein
MHRAEIVAIADAGPPHWNFMGLRDLALTASHATRRPGWTLAGQTCGRISIDTDASLLAQLRFLLVLMSRFYILDFVIKQPQSPRQLVGMPSTASLGQETAWLGAEPCISL